MTQRSGWWSAASTPPHPSASPRSPGPPQCTLSSKPRAKAHPEQKLLKVDNFVLTTHLWLLFLGTKISASLLENPLSQYRGSQENKSPPTLLSSQTYPTSHLQMDFRYLHVFFDWKGIFIFKCFMIMTMRSRSSLYLIRKFIHPKVPTFTHYDENNLPGSNSATTTSRFISVGLEKAVSANSFQVLALLSLEKSLA